MHQYMLHFSWLHPIHHFIHPSLSCLLGDRDPWLIVVENLIIIMLVQHLCNWTKTYWLYFSKHMLLDRHKLRWKCKKGKRGWWQAKNISVRTISYILPVFVKVPGFFGLARKYKSVDPDIAAGRCDATYDLVQRNKHKLCNVKCLHMQQRGASKRLPPM